MASKMSAEGRANENSAKDKKYISVAEFYHGRSIFITGGTGFMGKVLIEKLLRSCPGIKNIFILIRPKRGQDISARLTEILNSPLFDRIRNENPGNLKKVIPINGDITLNELGISEIDQITICQEVSIVFHSAATVKFDEKIKQSVTINMLGTKQLMELCHRMLCLDALVHVSTAYCNCDKKEVTEIIYPPPYNPDDIIQLVRWFPEDMLEKLTPSLIGNRPNSYTFTKAMAEHMLLKEAKGLPVSIVRPSIGSTMKESDIQNFYKNKNVFITGGTGFLGIAIVEKILRSCPEVGGIYLLMRPKKGKQIEERLKELTDNAVFETLLQQSSPDIFRKLHAVAGDVGEENLGLSPENRASLAQTIDVVIHSAATLDFQATLRPTVQINLLGTRRVMQLCREMQHLKCMVHVSSAYVNSYLKEADEKLYPAHEEAEKIIDLVNSLGDDALEQLTDKLLKDHPNTYTFTKHLAEHEVNKCAAIFPCGIVRPSMITGAWKEPVPGWTISKNGPQGFLMGAAKGVIRRLPVGTELIYDYIPVDTVVNQILVTAFHIQRNGFKELSIYHCTSSTCNPFRWDSVKEQVNDYLHKYPLKSAVWYPHLKFLPSLWLYKLSAIIVHFMPAYCLDFITKVFGGRPILVRLHTNVWESLNRLEKFIFSEWRFNNPKTLDVSRQLSPMDREMFNIDISELKWPEYFVGLAQGVRRYLNNEHPKTLAAARKKDTVLFFVHIAFQVLFLALFWALTAKLTGMSLISCIFVIPVMYFLLSLL